METKDQNTTGEVAGNKAVLEVNGAGDNTTSSKEDTSIEDSDKRGDINNLKKDGNNNDAHDFGKLFVDSLQRIMSNQDVEEQVRKIHRTAAKHHPQEKQGGREFGRFMNKSTSFLCADKFQHHLEGAHRYINEVFGYDGHLGAAFCVPYGYGPDEDSYPTGLFLITWLSSKHFDRHLENIDVDFIDYSGQTRFPEITFWESFYDEYPTQQMYFWRYTKEPITNPLFKAETKNAKSVNGKEKQDLANIVVAITTCNIKQRAEMSLTQLGALRLFLRQFFSYLGDQSRREEGNIKFELFTIPQSDSIQEESSSDFLIYEEWSHNSHYDKHTSSNHYNLLMRIAETCFSENDEAPTSDVQRNQDESSQRLSSSFLNVELWRYHSSYYKS